MSGLGHGPGQPSSPAVSAGPSGSARYGGGPRESHSPMSFTVAKEEVVTKGEMVVVAKQGKAVVLARDTGNQTQCPCQ